MKTIKSLFTILLLTISLVSCSSDSDDPIITIDPMSELTMVKSVTANGHAIQIYSEEGQFTVGYNKLFIRIKEVSSGDYLSDVEISWKPMMHMMQMMHSCPKSMVEKTEDASVYKGYTVFQMPGNVDEYWELGLEYTIDGQEYSVTERIEVLAPADEKKRVSVFMGSDDVRYVLAMVPLQPEVAVNDFSALLFKMESMMSFPAVEDYKIALDPRMPSMGNHSSPNNEDLSYSTSDTMYNGKLSLTMSGYWKINLKLLNENEVVLKGEDITEQNDASSLFFELEF